MKLSRLIGILEAREGVCTLPCLSLDAYREVVARIPPPTDQQIRKFALFVSEARSWYKHLPLVPPGAPLHFFIDPCAGMDHIILGDGRVAYRDRTPDAHGLHYTRMTTADYRSRFGWLAFGIGGRRKVSRVGTSGSPTPLPVSVPLQEDVEVTEVVAVNPTKAAIHMADGEEFQPPDKVLDAGTISVTGVIHRRAAGLPRLWLWQIDDTTQWPEETGGSETLRKILNRCRQLEGHTWIGHGMYGEDQELDRLIAPERQRLQEQMVLAMDRMVALLYRNTH